MEHTVIGYPEVALALSENDVVTVEEEGELKYTVTADAIGAAARKIMKVNKTATRETVEAKVRNGFSVIRICVRTESSLRAGGSKQGELLRGRLDERLSSP